MREEIQDHEVPLSLSPDVTVESCDSAPPDLEDAMAFYAEIDGEGMTKGWLADQPDVHKGMSTAVSMLLEAFGAGLAAVYDENMNPYYQRGGNPSA